MSIRNKVFVSILGALLLGSLLCGFVFLPARTGHQQVADVVNRAVNAQKHSDVMRARVHEAESLVERVMAMSVIVPLEGSFSFRITATSRSSWKSIRFPTVIETSLASKTPSPRCLSVLTRR